MVPSLSLLSYESSVSVKKTLIEKKIYLLTLVFVLNDFSLHTEILISFHWLSIKLKMGCPFHCKAYDYFVLIKRVLLIIWEMFHGITSLSLVLRLLVNFVSGFRLELMYIYLIISIRSSLTHVHGFQLLVVLP